MMAGKRGFVRTPEGAWYRGYAGLKSRTIYGDYEYPAPNDDGMPYYGSQPQRDPAAPNNGLYDRESFLYDPNEKERSRDLDTLMAQYYGSGPQSYRPYPDGKRSSWDHGRPAVGKGGDGDYAALKDDARQYDDAAAASKLRRGPGVDFKLYDPPPPARRNSPPADFKLYDPPARNSPVDFKYYDPPRQNGPPADFKLYDPTEPPPRHSPMDFKYSPRQNGPLADFKYYDPPARQNGPLAEFQPYESSPRNAGPGDGRQYESSKYPPPPQGEREWGEPQGRVSPRRMVAPYEPSFHDPGVSPRNIPPWERDRAEHRSPQPAYGYADGQGQGQGLVGKGVTQKSMISKQGGSVFLFIRFHEKSLMKIDQACQAARTRGLRGEFVGIAERVKDFGKMPGENCSGFAVFQFPSLTNAEEFFNRDRNFRQQDFPHPYGDTQIFAINLQTDPGTARTSFRTFLLSEVTLNDGVGEESLKAYRDKFVDPFTRFMFSQGALPFAALCDRGSRYSLRRHCFDRNDLVVLHLFRDERHYYQVWQHPRYKELRDDHNAIAMEKCSLFTVRPEICP